MSNAELIDELNELAEPLGACNHMKYALHRAAAALQAMEWQPIESAPKGGGAEFVTHPDWVEPPKILLKFDHSEIAMGRWDWAYADGGFYHSDGVAWIDPISGEQLNLHFNNPTEWKHIDLPSPPQGSGTKGFDWTPEQKQEAQELELHIEPDFVAPQEQE